MTARGCLPQTHVEQTEDPGTWTSEKRHSPEHHPHTVGFMAWIDVCSPAQLTTTCHCFTLVGVMSVLPFTRRTPPGTYVWPTAYSHASPHSPEHHPHTVGFMAWIDVCSSAQLTTTCYCCTLVGVLSVLTFTRRTPPGTYVWPTTYMRLIGQFFPCTYKTHISPHR